MAEVKIEFNSEGFKQILMSEGMKACVLSEAQKIQEKANDNSGGHFNAKAWVGNYGGGRYVASAFSTEKAESEDKALTKAVR